MVKYINRRMNFLWKSVMIQLQVVYGRAEVCNYILNNTDVIWFLNIINTLSPKYNLFITIFTIDL